ncbi:MAG: MFS transporter [Pseudomonadales bacterium]
MAEVTGVSPTMSASARRQRTWLMSLLTSAFALNLLDRQIINVLAEPIKRDLLLADWQLGALTGLSFALLYSVMGIPIARIADRGNRVRIIGVAVLVWSVFTAACGMAANFIQLLLLRIGVGVGEAGCAPPSQSLIADHFPTDKRAGALAVFNMGSPLGAAIGLAGGGLLADAVGWRWTLVCAGLPGMLIGLLVLTTLKDARPVRRRSLGERAWPVIRRLLIRRTFFLMALASALLSFVNYGAMAFAGSFFLRVHEADLLTMGEFFGVGPLAIIGLGLGVFGALTGAAGSYAGGKVADRLGSINVRALALIPAVGSLLCAVGYVVMFTVPSGAWGLFLFVFPAFFANLWAGPGIMALQELAGVPARATAMALVLFAQSAIGLGLGPLSIGIISDLLAPTWGAGEGLRLAILLGLVVGLVSSFIYWLASRSIKADLSAVEGVEV